MADAPAYQALDGAARAAYARKTYALLGLAPECGAAKLKRAYKKASLQYHPDKQSGKTDEEKAQELYQAYNHFQLRKACQLIMELATLGNTYFNAKTPWKWIKDDTKKKSLEIALSCCLRALHVLALVSFPIIPKTAEKLWKLLGYEKPLVQYSWKGILEGDFPYTNKLLKPEILFQKVVTEHKCVLVLHMVSIKECIKT